jgi:pectinesterase
MRFLWLCLLFLPLAHAAESSIVHLLVAADGSGDFKTIQMALDHAPAYSSSQRLVIELRPGRYHERVKVPQDRPRVTFLGKNPATTLVEFSVGAKDVGGTFFSSVVEVDGAEFHASNITFENTFGIGTQAVAVSIHSDRAFFENCHFLGWQDTVYAAMGRQYFRNCFIAGQNDFIFGNAAAVFDHCEIHSKGPGFITAQSRTSPQQATGYVFIDCKLTGENTGNGVFLGRPWRAFSRVIYIRCMLGGHIRPEGWDNWNHGAENENTAWYAELGSTGPGSSSGTRVSWVHKLTAEQAAAFYPQTFLRGTDLWNPTKIIF